MNISRVISSLKMQHGLYGITLPFKDENTGQPIPTENVIRDILATTTIPIFSQFAPWLREGTCNVRTLKCVDRENHIYMLPAFLTLTPIMYVSDVHLPFMNHRGTFGDIAPSYGINRSAQGVATSQAYMMLASQMRAEPTFKDMGHNQVQLYGWPSSDLVFEVAAEHLPNLESLEEGYRDSFMQLANLDLGEFLWNNLKNYSPIQTAHGEYQIKIDQYQGCTEAKEQLLERWRDTFHVDMDWTKFM